MTHEQSGRTRTLRSLQCARRSRQISLRGMFCRDCRLHAKPEHSNVGDHPPLRNQMGRIEIAILVVTLRSHPILAVGAMKIQIGRINRISSRRLGAVGGASVQIVRTRRTWVSNALHTQHYRLGGNNMKFEIGKYYKHTANHYLSISELSLDARLVL